MLKTTSRIGYFLLPSLYLAIGGTVTAMLVQRVLCYATTTWLVLLIPMLMVTVLLTVVGIVNVWLSYRTWREEGLLRQYSERSLLSLYLRCWGVVMAGLSLGIVFAWLYQLLPGYMRDLSQHLAWFFYVICAVMTLTSLMSVVLGEDLQEIRLRNAQSENQLLKAQLNPHFLYNTLNNIDALIWIDQEQASTAVTSLSSLMRYMTYSARQDSVSLTEEADAIRQLCSLQQLRMKCPDAVRLEIAGVQRLRLAPLLLIPLVENCFKHCGSTDVSNAVCIRLEETADGLLFETDNNLPAPAETTAKAGQHGVGLSVLRRRLELLYPGQYTFTTGREGDRFRTRLTIGH